MSFQLLSIIGVAVITVLGLWLWHKFKTGTGLPTTYDNGKAALDRMKDWAIWLSGLQTATLATMGLLAKGEKSGITLNPDQLFFGFYAVFFLGVSIILMTWVLACLPAIQQAMNQPSKEKGHVKNDIFSQNLFLRIPIKLGPLAFIAHVYCLCGFVAFALFIYHTIPTNSPG